MEELLGDISRLLRSTGSAGDTLADCLQRQWVETPAVGTPVAQLVDEEATWTVLLSGDIVATAACELALAMSALRCHRLPESGFLSHVAKVLVDTSGDPSLAALRSGIAAQIRQATQARRALIAPGNHAIDRGAIEEALDIYERALEALPGDDLALYELARTRYLSGRIGSEEYASELRPVLAANPFFEQAMGQAPADFADAFRTRLRPWAHDHKAGTVELCDFAAGALDAGLGWWAAIAYVTAAHVDLTLTDRLPQALKATEVSPWLTTVAPLGVAASALHDLLDPLRTYTRRVLRHLECGQTYTAPSFWSTDIAAQRVLREVAGDPAWASLIMAAVSVADAAEALVDGDPQRAYVLAQAALEAEPPSPIEHAHALEVQAAVLSGQSDGLTQATELLVKAVEAHKLSGSEVCDQARVLTRLAEHHRALSSPHDACLGLTRSLGLLASSDEPDQRLLVLDRYLLASSLAEVGEVKQAARAFADAQSLRETLTIVDVVSQELIVDVDERQHLLDDLRFREKAAHVDLIRTERDGPALLRELHEWHRLATDLGRPQSDLSSIERKVALVELEIARSGGA